MMISFRAIRAILVLVVTSSCTPSASPSDKERIESLISEFNKGVAVNNFDGLTALFTKDANYTDGSAAPIPAGTGIRRLLPKRQFWDERTALTMKVQKISFSSTTRTTVEAIQSDYAPMVGISRQWSCQFVLVRAGQIWRIASYRESMLPDLPNQ